MVANAMQNEALGVKHKVCKMVAFLQEHFFEAGKANAILHF